MGFKEARGFMPGAGGDTVKTFLRFILFLSLIVWLGGIIFFSSVVAPSIFSVLMPLTGGQHLAGNIVNLALNALHVIGLICGIVFVVASAILSRSLRRPQLYLVLVMMSLTLISLFWVTPQMIKLRQYDAMKVSAPATLPASFDYLHSLSVGLECAVLLLGLCVVWLTARDLRE